jgi:hypothetical protein
MKVTVPLTLLVLLASPPAFAESVSLIRVIANPKAFDQKPIQLVGFYWKGEHKEDGPILCVHEEDHRHEIFPNCIRLDLDPARLKVPPSYIGTYVLVTGTFFADGGDLVSGRLSSITRINVWSDPKHPRSAP